MYLRGYQYKLTGLAQLQSTCMCVFQVTCITNVGLCQIETLKYLYILGVCFVPLLFGENAISYTIIKQCINYKKYDSWYNGRSDLNISGNDGKQKQLSSYRNVT